MNRYLSPFVSINGKTNLRTIGLTIASLPVFAIVVISLAAERATCHADEQPKAFVNSLEMRMLPIPAGTFRRGNPHPRPDGWDEQPVHQVTISRPFFISEQEVSIEQFSRFRPEFPGSLCAEPAVTGVSWHDAVAFCEWLSAREGKLYRLPTEAEWEYAARAGTDSPFWSGDRLPAAGTPNPWGLRNVHSGAAEWCHDWYGPYHYESQADPAGPKRGFTRVIRGGGLDSNAPYYARSTNRASYGPAFGVMKGTSPSRPPAALGLSRVPDRRGLIGIWYGGPALDNAQGMDRIASLSLDWTHDTGTASERGDVWSAQWVGTLLAPASGEIRFRAATDHMMKLAVGEKEVIRIDDEQKVKSGTATLTKDQPYPIRVTYEHHRGSRSFLNVHWGWSHEPEVEITDAHLWHSEFQEHWKRSQIPLSSLPGHHAIGFRVVQAPEFPVPSPTDQPSFVTQCVMTQQPHLTQGPDPQVPWFRRRPLLPIPHDDVTRRESIAAGLHPGMLPHNHSPALGVCPNGDLLAIFFTSESSPGGENKPEVLLIASRLRYGTRQWDMPQVFMVLADANTVSPCLYTEKNQLYCFFGNTFYGKAYPFQWITSCDSGASWSTISFPQITNVPGPHTRQPVTNVFRGRDGTLFVPTDGKGATTVLWASRDDGQTWYDTGGRTFGRHTTFAVLKDGRILGMGGKKSGIDGYMPKSISSDGGRTWVIGKTPFPELGGGQRPTLIRLQSGRLFFAGDFQHKTGRQPAAVKDRGAYVALSDDEGETWHIKKLPGTLPLEDSTAGNDAQHTIGYAVSRQAPNGIIHLITTKNHPSLHFEMNEAWILSNDTDLAEPADSPILDVRQYAEMYSSGRRKAVWYAGISSEGEYLLHGKQQWYFEDGKPQWEATYEAGHKVGSETWWDRDGTVRWTWAHDRDALSVWTQYWPNGRKKAESGWRNFRAEGTARRWKHDGSLTSKVIFFGGRVKDGDH